MTELTEGKHPGEFLISEANGTLSREVVTIDTGVLVAGQVLGKVTRGAATAQAASGNSGGGTMGAVTVGAGAKAGDYKLTIIEPAAGLGNFIVEDPDGVNIGSGIVGTAFTGGGLSFTLADGDPDFAAGDQFTITVAPGSGKYVAYDPDAADGSEIAAAILYGNADASIADVEAVAIVRDAEVNGNEIVWPADITDDEKAAAIEQLAVHYILVRT